MEDAQLRTRRPDPTSAQADAYKLGRSAAACTASARGAYSGTCARSHRRNSALAGSGPACSIQRTTSLTGGSVPLVFAMRSLACGVGSVVSASASSSS
jgi:hypothetical protein